MKQYNTESKYLDVAVSDFSLPMWKEGLKFDAIITDRKFKIPNLHIKNLYKAPSICYLRITFIDFQLPME